MQLSELSRLSGLTPATIKFYLREGLLGPGASTDRPKRAEYGSAHLHRLRLIRTLTEVGGMPLARVRAVLVAVESAGLGTHELLGIAHSALPLPGREPSAAESERAAERALEQAQVDDYLDRLGWRIDPVQAPARAALAEALAALHRLGWVCDAEIFAPYAEVADRLAEHELASIPTDAPFEATVEAVVVGTAVFEAALTALRRLAQSHHSALRFPTTQPAAAPSTEA